MISETKIDDSFPVGSVIIEGFSLPYRLDCDSNDSGIMFYVRQDILYYLLATEEKNRVEGLDVELKLGNEKWLINCSYPNKTMISSHLDVSSKYLDLNSSHMKKS